MNQNKNIGIILFINVP